MEMPQHIPSSFFHDYSFNIIVGVSHVYLSEVSDLQDVRLAPSVIDSPPLCRHVVILILS